MAGDMLLLMRGLAKLSQAVIETQAISLRTGGVQAMSQSMQITTEQAMSVAMQKIQVGPVTSFQPLQCTSACLLSNAKAGVTLGCSSCPWFFYLHKTYKIQ